MNFYKQTFRIVILFLLLISGLLIGNFAFSNVKFSVISNTQEHAHLSVKSLNDSLLAQLRVRDLDKVKSKVYADRLLDFIKGNKEDRLTFSDSFYFLGIYYSYCGSNKTAVKYFSECISVKEEKGDVDPIYMKAYYNMSVCYARLGNLNKYLYCALKSLEIGKKTYNEFDNKLIDSYFSVGTAYAELREYDKSLNYMNIALLIADHNPGTVDLITLENVYTNMGVIYTMLYDFSKARIYYEKAESTYEKSSKMNGFDYISLLRDLALNNVSRNEPEEAAKYFEKAVKLSIADTSHHEYSIIYKYADFLSTTKKTAQGEKLLRTTLEKVKIRFGTDDRNYNEVLAFYGNYLRDNKIDYNKSLEYFEKCMEYVGKNDDDLYMKNMIINGYALTLQAVGKSDKALESIQTLLFNDELKHAAENPPLENLKPNLETLNILKNKYGILWDIYRSTGDLSVLKNAASTSNLVITVLDKVRINISEEESRLILGDKYRKWYLNIIRDFNLLYSITSDRNYLENAFKYSEKSKVAGLLASTRELKASQLQIPVDLANLESEMKRSIGQLEMRISDENLTNNPNTILISELKENLLQTVRERDSLILVFEKKYPDYYALKYNTTMEGFKDIPSVVGRNGNYINYILSDTLLYTFVVNRTHQKLLVQHIDSTYFSDIRKYRSLLSKPASSDNASENFKDFQTLGYKFYKTLVEPVRPYLVSDRVIISPDNFLSYLPFESFPTAIDTARGILYKELKYLMYDLDISYTYSATFMSDMVKRDHSNNTNLIAFAPDYPESIDIQSVMQSRQGNMGTLNDLPFARQEAEYVSGITGGKLYENNNAQESVFKKECDNYGIIHLAMHTLLNEKDPMRSTLIFSHANDSTEDGYLKTFEIYGIPLKAKMVVLSSCNTGLGMLYSGEGILSLARGFIYSGSLSVVMSMWEIEDRSGTEVVKMFYDNLKKGYSKSTSLRRARTSFLKDADQLRSHPYFWSSMVIYGNDSALYNHNKLKIFISILLSLLATASVYYYRKRRNS